MAHTVCRVDNGQYSRNNATRNLPRLESYLCRSSSMSVIIFQFYRTSTIPSAACAEFFFPGRDRDYQTLNINFAANVVKFGMIISFFPKPLKSCVLTSTRIPF